MTIMSYYDYDVTRKYASEMEKHDGKLPDYIENRNTVLREVQSYASIY